LLKNKKAEIVAKIKQRFSESDAVFVVNQDRMTVAESEDFRRRLKGADSTYLVAKNTLARLAVGGSSFECILPHLEGQTALVFSKNITSSAKAVFEYSSKSEDKITIICGGYDQRLLSASDIRTLAQLPSMNELRAKIVVVVQTPARRMATLLQAPAGQLARVLNGYSEKQ
jgi:large subunit ribosomal protein L10